jgi:glutathione synthase/RimK-type ligase-like ATP-grasp enzyme
VNKIGGSIKQIFRAFKKIGPKQLQLDATDYTNIVVELGVNKHFRIYHKGYDLKKYDYIYIRNWKQNSVIAAVIAQYCKLNNVKFDDEHLLKLRDDCKLLQNTLYTIYGLPIPHTLFYTSDILPVKYKEIRQKLGDPFILKDAQSNRGKNNYLIKNKEAFIEVVNKLKSSDLYICQEFIINNYEYRYLTFGGKVEVVMKRSQPEDSVSHKNNSYGMKIEYITDKSKWDYKSWTELISREIMEREILGIDYLIEAKTGNPYILEANPAPGIISRDKESIIKADKFLEYIKTEVKS